ncbi:hypothetical protein GQ55_3G093400 [Panicum hallii var. hallii]|uniref:Secreted protein n=1 Tax=Panicum hallii var. hallii TaxID=1504633 RepID=A0A2T7E7F9_9POAL|nr:hypothetical protein GQ55_3G093400 [Panicum hallii var. hallii]
MLLTVLAAMTMFFTTICSWMASSGDAPPMTNPIMAPGSAISPTVLALSMTGASAIPSDLLTCCNVASRGVAPKARAVSTCTAAETREADVTVMAQPTSMPATGMMYRGVNGKTLSAMITSMVTAVPTRMDTKAMYLPRGTCFARCPAV